MLQVGGPLSESAVIKEKPDTRAKVVEHDQHCVCHHVHVVVKAGTCSPCKSVDASQRVWELIRKEKCHAAGMLRCCACSILCGCQ